MADVTRASRFILVAAPSDLTNKEWENTDPTWIPPPPTHRDYALMKVLSMLRKNTTKTPYRVIPFKWEEAFVPVDFSGLQDDEIIFIVGHGSDKGLYPMGPDANENTKRLVKLLTNDGNLKAKRKDKDIIILILSCRAGFGYHKAVARKMFKELGRDLETGGAIGYTFGSPRTAFLAENEVLIQGLPWFIEYPDDVYNNDPTEAEKETSAREGKTITFAGKKAEIEKFVKDKEFFEDQFKTIVKKLKNTEVNKALDELEKDFGDQWTTLIWSQFKLYTRARKASNLEFDMWFDLITDGYVWTTGKKTTDAQMNSVMTGSLKLIARGVTTVK